MLAYLEARTMTADNSLRLSLDKKAAGAFISPNELRGIIVDTWIRALDAYLEDGVLSESEENALVTHAKTLGISNEDLRSRDVFTKVAMGRAIRNVMNASVPDFIPPISIPIPFNFQKSEKTLWFFSDINYAEEVTSREYVGGSRGASIRVMKGVHYRIGASRGHIESRSQMQIVDNGMLAVTTKHIYFAGKTKGFRIPYEKIVSFQPFLDAIGIIKEAARPKMQIFMTREGWFIYNLIVNAAQIEWK